MKIVLFALIFLAGFVFAFGQDEPLRVETNLVTVNVSVTDDAGKTVKNLRREQFEIYDSRRKQEISYFSAEAAPVAYGIVYDMHPTTDERTASVLESLRAFTKTLRPTDTFFVLAFGERGSLSADFIPTVEQINKHLPDRREPNSLYDSIFLAGDKLRESSNLKRTLIVVSDSADHNSRHSFAELSRNLKKMDVQIYSVIFDGNKSYYRDETLGGGRRAPDLDSKDLERAAIQDLSLKSGGETHFPVGENSRTLFEIYTEIAARTRDQYSLSFYPDVADGKWHDLRVNLRGAAGGKRFALTYRRGYQSRAADDKK